MLLPDNIAEYGITLKDQYFDLKGLSLYSALKIPSLRDYIRYKGLPCFKVKGKILIKKSEFDRWIEGYRVDKKKDLDQLVNGVLKDLKSE